VRNSQCALKCKKSLFREEIEGMEPDSVESTLSPRMDSSLEKGPGKHDFIAVRFDRLRNGFNEGWNVGIWRIHVIAREGSA